jgi:hypothetical protein
MLRKIVLAGVTLVGVASSAPGSNFNALQSCVTGALGGGPNATARIQTPANNTWEDAYVGAIMYVTSHAMNVSGY